MTCVSPCLSQCPISLRAEHPIYVYCRVFPGNATNNLWVLDLILDLFDIRQAELQLSITLSILL
jgi:hypothetical protein